MTTFGSTQAEETLPPEAIAAARTRAQTATIAGISVELQLQAQRMEQLLERLDRTEKLFLTLQGQFEQLQAQRIRELQLRVNGGPTTV